MCLLIAVRTRIEWIRGTKLNKSPLPIQPAPERMQSRQPQLLDESGTLRRDPIRAPISGDAIQQTNLRLLRLRSALCRTTWTIRRTELRECAAGFGVVAGRVRTAPPQNQIPSRRGRCESMQGECAPTWRSVLYRRRGQLYVSIDSRLDNLASGLVYPLVIPLSTFASAQPTQCSSDPRGIASTKPAP